MRLLAVAEDDSGNIGTHAVEVQFVTPDTTAPQFVNSTPQAAIIEKESTQLIVVDLELSEAATVTCAVMTCFPGVHEGDADCSHVIGVPSGNLLQQSMFSEPSSSGMWVTAINSTAVSSPWERQTLLLQAELVCFAVYPFCPTMCMLTEDTIHTAYEVYQSTLVQIL